MADFMVSRETVSHFVWNCIAAPDSMSGMEGGWLRARVDYMAVSLRPTVPYA